MAAKQQANTDTAYALRRIYDMCITNKIIFAGTGRLGEVCLKALQQKFDAIDIVNNGANDNIELYVLFHYLCAV